MKKLLMVAAIIGLCGCVAKTSPQRHTLYFANHEPSMMGGNYVKRPDATAKSNLPVYQEMYKKGQEAKAKHLTPEQAQLFADEIYKVDTKSTDATEIYMDLKEHRDHIEFDERTAKLWGQTLKDIFLDGYNGVN